MFNREGVNKVLIVDDEDMIRILLEQVMERIEVDHLQILMAEDGQEALEIALDERPNLILLDLLLPKMNGYDVCRELRAIPGYDPYIIVLTARGQNTDRIYSKEIGANDFMTKPFNPSQLVTELNRLWHQR